MLALIPSKSLLTPKASGTPSYLARRSVKPLVTLRFVDWVTLHSIVFSRRSSILYSIFLRWILDMGTESSCRFVSVAAFVIVLTQGRNRGIFVNNYILRRIRTNKWVHLSPSQKLLVHLAATWFRTCLVDWKYSLLRQTSWNLTRWSMSTRDWFRTSLTWTTKTTTMKKSFWIASLSLATKNLHRTSPFR